MADRRAQATSRNARLIAWLAVGLMAILIILGMAWYGLSAEVERRVWHNIAERPSGPMAFRFLLQPAMAFLAALHDGINDARLGRPPYFRTLMRDPARRNERIREAFLSTGRILLLGLGMDAIYQYRVLNTFFPGEMVLVALLLAFLPYLAFRGLITRIARWRILQHPHPGPSR
ncbi:hypothetical protein [Microvirga lotononidis]|uniref:Uncharacterized protein n=1 Tax=Microvirga lotononidis TaxID=864069 RepID=I4YKU0_9HYPH|nr:hypothetical protein [Microvirga lotononidis]EIM24582.1 hypothetical protein MicloDRAFT_00052970 [Microvirga lotononidis]WQO26600.1 hypothetical protein U0023_18250 [Microvirga lotononidis]